MTAPTASRSAMRPTYCCDMMDRHSKPCEHHANDPYACPDQLISYYGKVVGIRVHDGGTAFVVIKFCPWCGLSLDTMA